MNLLENARGHRKELIAAGVAIVVLWILRSLLLGNLRSEIEQLEAALPARRALLTRVQASERDARTVDAKLESLRKYPLPALSLAAALEKFDRERGPELPRARLAPRGVQPLGANLQEESVEVMLPGLTLSEMVQYISGVETLSPTIRLRSVKILKTGETATLTLVVASLRAT